MICFEFKRTDGTAFPTFSGGAHTVVTMQDDDRTRLNPYSLMSDPADTSTYAISVRRDDQGRGGSLDLHARKHLFFAGGIGITPFMSMIAQLEQSNGNWELHYSVRAVAPGTNVDELCYKYPNKVHFCYDDQSDAIPLEDLLDGQPLGTNAYVCRPKGMRLGPCHGLCRWLAGRTGPFRGIPRPRARQAV